jgi:hypothetical protein
LFDNHGKAAEMAGHGEGAQPKHPPAEAPARKPGSGEGSDSALDALKKTRVPPAPPAEKAKKPT